MFYDGLQNGQVTSEYMQMAQCEQILGNVLYVNND